MEVIVSALEGPSPDQLEVEVVERKGLGHPDTLCDALAEAFGRSLAGYYVEHFGRVLHFNVDKALLCGGRSRPAFGGGEVLEPIELDLAGRATCEWGGVSVPVEKLALDSTRGWLRAHMHALDPELHVRVRSRVRPGSADLVELFARRPEGSPPSANDTSCGVGFAPLSRLEATVLGVEHVLNDPSLKRRHPELGEDVKVMGVRRGSRVALTVACAFVDRFVHSLDEYQHQKMAAIEVIRAAARERFSDELEIALNAADDPEGGSVYLTVTGTSAEAGDDGEVGRGNRVNGLITPFRPMTLEAAAGKNPVSHVGKLYNVVAQQIADDVLARREDVVEAHCTLVSRIGAPITEPAITSLQLRTAEGVSARFVAPGVAEIAQERLERVPDLWRVLAHGSAAVVY